MAFLDKNGDGVVDYDEFLVAIRVKNQEMRLKGLQKGFKLKGQAESQETGAGRQGLLEI